MIEHPKRFDLSTAGLESLSDLDLHTCASEKNPVTGEIGWKAPVGYAFKMNGQFETWAHQQRELGMMISAPQSSLDLLKATHPGVYEDCLEETDGDEKSARELFIEAVEYMPGDTEAPTEFAGKWLVISPNIDGTKTVIQDEELGEVIVMVKEGVESWAERGVITFGKPESKDSTYIFESPDSEVRWRQWYARGIPGHFQIELVERPEEENEVYTSEAPNAQKIHLPLGSLTSAAYCEYLERMTGEKISEEERWQLIRKARSKGEPFTDDPLKHMVGLEREKITVPKSKPDFLMRAKNLEEGISYYVKEPEDTSF